MKQICILASILAFLIIETTNCQTNPGGSAKELEGMFSRIRDNIEPDKKLAINDSIKQILEHYILSDTVFTHRFSNLRYLGQITSPDSLLKIITWNLILQDGANRYFCYFICRSFAGAKNTIYKLFGNYNEAPVRTDTIYTGLNWYGALYYDVRPFVTSGVKYYVLLGIDYGNSFITRKIIDILSFGQDDSIIFGKKCFADGNVPAFRVVFEYSSKAVMSLKFDTDISIVFDHLSPFSPDLKDNREYYGPDFSFDSYSLVNGLWRLKPDVDIRNKK